MQCLFRPAHGCAESQSRLCIPAKADTTRLGKRRSGERTDSSLFLVFIRALNPKERLEADHVARIQIRQITADALDECEKLRVGLGVRLRAIGEVESIFRERNTNRSFTGSRSLILHWPSTLDRFDIAGPLITEP